MISGFASLPKWLLSKDSFIRENITELCLLKYRPAHLAQLARCRQRLALRHLAHLRHLKPFRMVQAQDLGENKQYL